MANIDDAEQITKNNVLLAKESENLTIEDKTAFEGVKAVLSDEKKGFYLVAVENNKIIGQLMITFEWSDWHNKNIWWLQSVYVHKSWRRKGTFSTLFNDIMKKARENNVDVLRLYVFNENTKAIDTYNAIGMDKKNYSIYQIYLKS